MAIPPNYGTNAFSGREIGYHGGRTQDENHGGRTMQPMEPTMTRGKEKTVAGILGILLGGFGVHHFYLGSTTSGVIELALSVITCGIGGLLGIVEGVMILIMSDEEFNQRYNYRTPESMEFVFMKPKTMGGGGVPPTPPPPPYQT